MPNPLDVFDLSLSEVKRLAKRKGALVPPAPPKPKTGNALSPREPVENLTALVLVITKTTCSCCGAEHLQPEREALLEYTKEARFVNSVRVAKPLIHQRRGIPPPHWRTLPRRLSYTNRTTPHCHLCWEA